jgi:hypothetical protein
VVGAGEGLTSAVGAVDLAAHEYRITAKMAKESTLYFISYWFWFEVNIKRIPIVATGILRFKEILILIGRDSETNPEKLIHTILIFKSGSLLT